MTYQFPPNEDPKVLPQENAPPEAAASESGAFPSAPDSSCPMTGAERARLFRRRRGILPRALRTVLPSVMPKPILVQAEKPKKHRPIGIMKLTWNTCRWMETEKLYCGMPTGGGSYCPEHRKIVYMPFSPR